jgi:hypothetical protein
MPHQMETLLGFPVVESSDLPTPKIVLRPSLLADNATILAHMHAEIGRQQIECQGEIDAAWAEFRAFLRSGAEGDIEPFIMRSLALAMRMELIPDDVADDYRMVYGLL